MRAPRLRRGPSASRRPTTDAETRPRPDSRTYEEKLIAALRGPPPDRRILAARILARLRSRAAIRTLEAIAREREDPYVAAEAARALAAIDPDQPVVAEIARGGSALARNAVQSVTGLHGGIRSPPPAPRRKEGPRDR